MLDWLSNAFTGEADLSLGVATIRLVSAFAFGCAVAFIYRSTRGRDPSQGAFVATLVLLTILLCMTTIVIGNNVARAFSIVGALSIVRFRTVVEDTRDTAFVIFAVGVGMAVGAGYFMVPLIVLPIVAIAASLYPHARDKKGAMGTSLFTLTIRVGVGATNQPKLESALQKFASSVSLLTLETARGGAALERSYALHLLSDGAAEILVAELNAIEGVQSVELQRKV